MRRGWRDEGRAEPDRRRANRGAGFQTATSEAGADMEARLSASVFEAPSRVAGFDDVAAVRQAVEHGGDHLGVAEDLRPIGKGEIGHDQQRRILLKLADQME